MTLEPTVFLIIALPFAIWAAYSDLKYMRIPNVLVLVMLGCFLVAGVAILPFTDVFLWRLLVGAITLAAGFMLFAIGGLGGGDAKFAAVMVMFVPTSDLTFFLFILAVMSLAGIVTHRLMRKMPFAAPVTGNWESWSPHGNFPMGFPMAGALVFYLAYKALS